MFKNATLRQSDRQLDRQTNRHTDKQSDSAYLIIDILIL